MAFITLITSGRGRGVVAVEIDATLNVQPKVEVEVTDHPVEKGGNISDHARFKPEIVTIEGIVSNTPMPRSGGARVVSSKGYEFHTTSSEDAPRGAAGRAEEALAKLREMRGQYVTIATERRTYRNMMLTSLDEPLDPKTGDAVRFTATFKEVLVVEVRKQEVTVTREAKAKKKVSTGKQVGKTAAEPDKSLLKRGTDYFTGGSENTTKLIKGAVL